MYICINFYITDKETHKKFLFWSCVLDTICTGIDYKYLNNGNEYVLREFQNLSIVEEFKEFSFSDIDSDRAYQKRFPVFLPKDQSFETGSPYRNCCSELISYYRKPEFFVGEIKECFSSYADFEILKIQKSVINKIKELVGFDLIKMQSYPGCISIFQPLPKFDVDTDLKNRTITIVSKSIDDFTTEIEGISVESSIKSKIVFKQLYFSENKKLLEIRLPENVEIFYTLHITIFNKEQDSLKCIYEEFLHMIKNVSIGMNIKSGSSILLKNRFLNNQIERKEVSECYDNFSVGDNSDFTDWDRQYQQYLFGKEKRYLVSRYFFKDGEEKKAFLEWIRSILSDAKKVFLIDPFLSANGLKDFVSCYNSYFSLTVITTDPKSLKRVDDKNKESENLAELIYNEFPPAQVYYVDKEELHDRYMIVETIRDTIYYSFSNSWQGLLKDYSLLIQEIDYESSLKLKSDYEKVIKGKQSVAKLGVSCNAVNNSSENEKPKMDIKQALEVVGKIGESDSVEHIIESFCSLFDASSHWWEVLDEFDNAYQNVQSKKKEIIHKLVNQLLVNEKRDFEEKRQFVIGKKFSVYNDVSGIMERIRTCGFCRCSYYDLGLDYAQFYTLSCLFIYEDELVVSELESQEEQIFDLKIDRKNDNSVSELILSLMLNEYFAIVNDRNMSKTIEFAKKTKYSYCRLFVAMGIYNGNYSKDFSEMIKYIEQIPLSDEELICFLYSIYTSKIFDNCKTEEEKNYPIKIERYVYDKFLDRNVNFILQFARQAYFVNLKKLNLQAFDRFLLLFDEEKKIEIREKTYLFFLLYAVRKSQNNKLYDFLKKELNIDSQYFACIEDIRDIRLLNEDGEFSHKKSVVDIGEFRSQIPILATALTNQIEKKDNIFEIAKKLLYKFDIQKKLLTCTCFYCDAGLDYFSILIILHTLYLLKDNCSRINEIVKKIDWYIPVLLNSAPDDFYGFSYSVIGLYFQFIDESEKQILFEKLSDERIRILCMSMLYNQTESYLNEYETFFTSFNIDDDRDKSKNTLYALNIFVNLCLIKHEMAEEDKELFVSVCEKIADIIPAENNPRLKNILNNGIVYIREKTESAKNKLLESMEGAFFPYSILSTVEGDA